MFKEFPVQSNLENKKDEQTFEQPKEQAEAKLPDFNAEHSPELEKFLGAINFEELDNILNDKARQLGLPDKHFSCLRGDRIGESEKERGLYSDFRKAIEMNLQTFLSAGERRHVDPDKFATQLLIHEEIHAISDQRIEDPKDFIPSRQVGYYQKMKQPHSLFRKKIYRLWNEGVTEKFSRELYHDYALRIHQMTPEELALYEKNVSEYETTRDLTYQGVIQLIDAFTERIAKKVGVSPELVWNSIVRGLLSGERWNEIDFDELSRDILPPGFMDKLQKLPETTAIDNIIEELKSEGSSESPSKSGIINTLRKTIKDVIGTEGKI